MSGDLKDTSGKAPLHLVPLSALDGVAHVMAFGDSKYRHKNWLAAVDEGRDGRMKYIAACLRHLRLAWDDPDAVDPESGLSHLDHATTCLLFEREIARRQR